jgi:hypothetical protein
MSEINHRTGLFSNFAIDIYTYRLSVYVHGAADYLPLHDNNHRARITCYHPPPSENVPLWTT